MNIIVVAVNNYPSPDEPYKGSFVYKLIQEFVKQGHEVYVFAPDKMFASKSNKEVNYGNERATVLRPRYFSLSNKQFFGFNTYHIGRRNLVRALKSSYVKLDIEIDIVYAHFISNALIAVDALQKYNIPIFAAVGEYKNIDITKAYYENKKYYALLNKINAYIAVSPQVQEKLLSLDVPEKKIIVEPNATDLKKFKPRNKKELRIKYGLPADKKILLFVGRFIENKGALRVQEALNKLADNVVAIFIGKGPQQPNHPKIVFSGAVDNDAVAEYMSLADVFVLPTQHEGSSNVIVEAMASGLPIVSSDLPEIRVQCKQEYATLVDPMSVDDIANALNTILSNDNIREKMSQSALKASKRFDINQRAQRILQFINQNY
jgi:teichuronic acid biosynthesis glycosyltransferase TuaC